MELLANPIVEQIAERNRQTLAAALEKDGIYVIDNSILSSFVRGEVYGEQSALTLSELWHLERRAIENWISLLDDKTTFPHATIQEFRRGISRLEGFAGNPRGALIHRWGIHNLAFIEPQECANRWREVDLAKDELRATIKLMKELSHCMPIFPSKAYVAPEDRNHIDSIHQALLEFNEGSKKKRSLAQASNLHQYNDKLSFAIAVAISYRRDTYGLTRDHGQLRLRDFLYGNMEQYSLKHGFPIPGYNLGVLLRDTKPESKKTIFVDRRKEAA